jgi:hypothetical protein
MGEKMFPTVCGNQRGMALLLVVCLLAMLSLLGFFALNTTDVELAIAGNRHTRQQAFFAAERAVEYVLADAALLNAADSGEVVLDPGQATVVAAETASGIAPEDACRVRYLSEGPVPPDSGSDPTRFALRSYRISAVGAGPAGARARVEAQVGRVVVRGE